MIYKKLSIFLLFLVVSCSFTLAQTTPIATEPPTTNEILLGTIKEIGNPEVKNVYNQEYTYTDVKISVKNGTLKGQDVMSTTTTIEGVKIAPYKIGQEVLVLYTKDNKTSTFYITDFFRLKIIGIIFAAFLLFFLLLLKKTGFIMLLKVVYSFAILYKFTIPMVMSGKSPLVALSIYFILVFPIIYFLEHGFDKHIFKSLISNSITFILTLFSTMLLLLITNISGYSTADSLFLQAAIGTPVSVLNFLVISVLIVLLFVIEYLSYKQIVITEEILETNKDKTNALLSTFDKISPAVSTFFGIYILVIVGVMLPLFTLLFNKNINTLEIVNAEIIAQEIVRVLAFGFGILFIMPITTLTTILFATNKKR